MKKSEKNRLVLENFVLFFTHENKQEAKSKLAKQLYKAVKNYIKEDHVDGVDGDEDEQ